MRPTTFLIPLLLANSAAFAGSINGNSGLALAALVAQHSPNVKTSDKRLLEKFLDGRTNVTYASKNKIAVAADIISCKASNVDITLHSCDLSFGEKKVTTTGRKAHELYATLIEAGVPSDGAAGSVFEASPI